MKTNKLSGFTLIELIITTAILSFFISGLVAFDRLLSESQTLISQSSESFNEANIGVEAMIKEMRNAKYSDNGAYPISLVEDQQIVFYSNIDNDPDVEKIRYFVENNELKRGVINPVGNPATYPAENEQVNLVINFVQNQSNPVFYYYNGDWPTDTVNNPLPAPARLADTKMIKVVLTINPKPTRPESQYTIESYAQIRNLKTNL